MQAGSHPGPSVTSARRALTNTALNGVRFAAVLVANVATSVFIARGLGPAGTGAYSFAYWLAGTLALLASVGLPATVTKYVSEFLGRGEVELARTLGRRLVRWAVMSAFALAFAGAWIAAFSLRGDERVLVWLALALLVPQAIQQIATAALAGWQRYDSIAWLSLYGAGAQVGLVAGAWGLGEGLVGMLGATLAGAIIWAVLAYIACARIGWRGAATAPPDAVRAALRRARRFWWAAAYAVVLDVVIWQRSEVLFLKWCSPLAQIAFYSLAFIIAGKLGQLATVFSGVLLPLCSERFGRSGLLGLWPVYRNSLRFVQMGIVPLCAYGVVAAGPLMRAMYGARFTAAVPVLRVLLVALACTCIGSVGNSVLLGADRPDVVVPIGTPVAALNIGLDFLLIRHLQMGAIGAAFANAAAQVVGVAAGLAYLHRILGRGFPWASSGRIVGAAVGSAAIMAVAFGSPGAGWLPTLLVAAAAVAVYPALLLALGELGRADWELARKLLPHRPVGLGA